MSKGEWRSGPIAGDVIELALTGTGGPVGEMAWTAEPVKIEATSSAAVAFEEKA